MATDNFKSGHRFKFHKILNPTDKKISLEVCPKEDLDFNLLSKLKPRFCSVTWRVKSEQDYRENVENSAPLIIAKKLCEEGYYVVLNIPGMHFSESQVLEILNKSKSIGVRGIFAIQGGKYYKIFIINFQV